MGSVDIIDISSDDEGEDIRDVKPILPLQSYAGPLIGNISDNTAINRDAYIKRETEEFRSSDNTYSLAELLSSSANGGSVASPSSFPSVPICRQFWRSGEYEVAQSINPISQSGRNRLRINPRFLHSNATSHKWAFGAIAELLDNAIDEVEKGATFVMVDKFTNPLNVNPTLLIQDDGGGMNPESLRRCMSFGFSEKQSTSSIGEYGNGFKTSTMRLGSDVITFTRCMRNRILTQSVGLLSYTFLVQTGCDDIVVPTVDYKFDPLINSYKRSSQFGERQFSSNLSAILKWSPFSSEAELLKQFDEIGQHGTRIIIFNLWLNDEGQTEIDFDSDQKDILISGSRNKFKNTLEHMLTEKYIASQIQYSLRAYSSILYLRIPENFRILLRGHVVKPHFVANDLIYRECVLYKPQIAGMSETVVFTTIGFLEGAPNVNIHGFNVYHKNRLILPFWKVANNSYGKGRGVVGILETNFIKPTHDKQGFEKSNLYQKLETRLKEMTYEYWDLHCHLVGYDNKKHPRVKIPPAPGFHMPQVRKSNSTQEVKVEYDALATSNQLAIERLPPAESTEHIANSQPRLSEKRKGEEELTRLEGLKICKVTSHAESGSKQKGCVTEEKLKEIKTMLKENKKLRQECFEYEKMEKQLTVKAQRLRSNLLAAQLVYKNLQIELQSMDVKVEKQ